METNDYVNAGIALLAIAVGLITGLIASFKTKWKREAEQDYKEREQSKFNDTLLKQLEENVKVTQEVYVKIHYLNSEVEAVKEENKELNTFVNKLSNEVSRLKGQHDN